MRPVLAGVVSEYQAAVGGRRLDLMDFADMNDALDVKAENERRWREAIDNG